MKDKISLDYRYLKYATMIFFAAGMAGAYILLRCIRLPIGIYWPVFAGMAMPSAILAGLFIYKCRVGIKKTRLGLSRWALFVSLTLLPYHALIWYCHRSMYPWFAPALVVFQFGNLILAANPPFRTMRFMIMPFSYSLASFILQFFAMLLAKY